MFSQASLRYQLPLNSLVLQSIEQQCYSVHVHTPQVMIVLELLANGDLRSYLIKKRPA